MSDALKAATEDLRLLCDLYENGSPITMSAAQFVAESGRTILAALRERDAEHVAALQQAIAAEREAKNAAYSERNMLAMLLAAEHGGWLRDAVPSEPGWTKVLIIPTVAGQISFHLHDSEVAAVLACPSVKQDGEPWDGHDNATKWQRVGAAAIRARGKEAGDANPPQ